MWILPCALVPVVLGLDNGLGLKGPAMVSAALHPCETSVYFAGLVVLDFFWR